LWNKYGKREEYFQSYEPSLLSLVPIINIRSKEDGEVEFDDYDNLLEEIFENMMNMEKNKRPLR
jgi:hypothetical protein